jgi:aspartyl protease family protein
VGAAVAAALVLALTANGLGGLGQPRDDTAAKEAVQAAFALRKSIFADSARSAGVAAPTGEGTRVVLMPARTMEIRAGPSGHYVTTVEIERTPIVVLIDTGATKVALSYEDADRAGLKPFSLDFSIPVATANGIAKAAPVTIRRIEVGNIVVRDVEAVVLPEGAFSGTLLGMSFLSRLSSFGIRDGVLVLEE